MTDRSQLDTGTNDGGVSESAVCTYFFDGWATSSLIKRSEYPLLIQNLLGLKEEPESSCFRQYTPIDFHKQLSKDYPDDTRIDLKDRYSDKFGVIYEGPRLDPNNAAVPVLQTVIAEYNRLLDTNNTGDAKISLTPEIINFAGLKHILKDPTSHHARIRFNCNAQQYNSSQNNPQ